MSPNSNTVAAESKLLGNTRGACNSWKMDGKVLSGSSSVRKRGHRPGQRSGTTGWWPLSPSKSCSELQVRELTGLSKSRQSNWAFACPGCHCGNGQCPVKGDFLECWVVSGPWVLPVKPLLWSYWLRPKNKLPKPSFFSFTSQDNNSSARSVL